MKARFFALAALVLGLASCQQEFDGAATVGGEVDFQLKVDARELGTTRAYDGDDQYGYDSAFGAIDYLCDDNDEFRTDWTEVDLRYSLEVYDANGLNAAPVKDRQVIIVDKYESVTFDLRLVPNRDYQFVVFADFVPQGASAEANTDIQKDLGLHHVINGTLQNITIKKDAINDESTDAYFATEPIRISNSAAKDIELKRPYGKVRVIATDLHELNLNVEPKSVKVTYEAAHRATFNAVTGDIDAKYETVVYENKYNDIKKTDMSKHIYTGYNTAEYKVTNANNETRNTHMTLFTDYILATKDQESIHFTMEVFDEAGVSIKKTNFNTDIPVQRNYLTTIIGNVLTTATEVNVTIDDNFAGRHYFNLWDGKSIQEPTREGEIYIIYEAAELAWFADQVNNKSNKFSGKTLKLGKDIHLNHELWTPIGATGKFEGTFDGDGFKIEGVFVSVKGKSPAGLFANAKYVRNLTVVNSQVYGNYKTGVIVGDGLCSRIDNCHVDGCEVVVTPYNQDEANNVGGIVGYLSAENEAWVKNCTVKNTQITAYRKVGGIAGSANQAAVVTGNKVENISVVADMTAEYKEAKAADAGAIVGYTHAKATVADNTIGADVSVVVRIDTNGERDAYVAKEDERIHVAFKAGEYNFSKDLNVNGSIEAKLGGTVVLNVEDKTITSGTTEHYGLIAKGEGNTLVINKANAVSYGGGVAAGEGAKVIFNSGKVDITKYTKSSPARYNFYARGGEIEINDGVFTFGSTNKTRRAYVCVEGGGKVVINGGTFGKASTRDGYTGIRELDGEVIINAGKFGFDPTQWVSKNSLVMKVGNEWIVTSDEVSKVLENAENRTIYLAEGKDYRTVTAGELKNVTIVGGENSVLNFITDSNSKLENVTLKSVDFVYDGSNANSGIVIDAAAQIDNLVVEGCSFVGTGAKAGRGIYGQNSAATITLKNCSFEDLGYPIYTMAGGGYASLVVEGCTFEGIKSWAIMPQYNDYAGDLTITGNQFINCVGGLVKAGKFTAGHTFTFTNNVVTNSAEHPAKNWFTIDTTAAAKVVENNTKDGQAWTPAEAEGLK